MQIIVGATGFTNFISAYVLNLQKYYWPNAEETRYCRWLCCNYILYCMSIFPILSKIIHTILQLIVIDNLPYTLCQLNRISQGLHFPLTRNMRIYPLRGGAIHMGSVVIIPNRRWQRLILCASVFYNVLCKIGQVNMSLEFRKFKEIPYGIAKGLTVNSENGVLIWPFRPHNNRVIYSSWETYMQSMNLISLVGLKQ